MSLIRRPNPFGELMSLRQAMDRLFEDSFVRPYRGSESDNNTLALDVYATADSLVVEAALPGVKPDDVEITVLGDTLTISAKTVTEQSHGEDGYTHREIRRGSFVRTVTLPSGLRSDAATASFENGLLRLSFPKAEEAQLRQIQINAAPGEQASRASEVTDGSSAERAAPGPAEESTDRPETAWQARPDWSSTGQVTEQSHEDLPATEWQSTSEWQAGDQWQADGQGNGQPRVEQAS